MEVIEPEAKNFLDLALDRGYKIEKSSREMSRKGIDFHMKGVYRAKNKEVHMLVAVKRKKSPKPSKYLDRWTWVEFKGTGGVDGWIYGIAHFIAFERSHDYVVVSRKALLDYVNSAKCKIRWDLPFVSTPREAKYRIYQNPKTRCQITQILSKDIIKLEGAQVWKK